MIAAPFERWMVVPGPKGLSVRPNPRYVEPDVALDPKALDGTKTVIIHGCRMTEYSPRARWPHAELWGVGRCNVRYWHRSLTDWTRWFDLHPVERTAHHKGIRALRPEALAWYRRQDPARPIYLLERDDSIPASVAFPRAWIQETLQTTQFTVSVDWIIALALCEGFGRIVLNGIGTRFNRDYQFTHHGILYWIGYARGKGVDVVVEGRSCYASPTQVYGYECAAPTWTSRSDDSSMDREDRRDGVSSSLHRHAIRVAAHTAHDVYTLEAVNG